MPTVPRRPAAPRERDRLKIRRLRAAELFTAGVRQAKVALMTQQPDTVPVLLLPRPAA
jgi:hypothetical protein